MVLIGLVALFFLGMTLWKRRFYAEDPTDFTIDSVEEMHQAGLITDEEFSRIRRKALGLDKSVQGPVCDGEQGAQGKSDSPLSRPGKVVDSTDMPEGDDPPQDEEHE